MGELKPKTVVDYFKIMSAIAVTYIVSLTILLVFFDINIQWLAPFIIFSFFECALRANNLNRKEPIAHRQLFSFTVAHFKEMMRPNKTPYPHEPEVRQSAQIIPFPKLRLSLKKED